MDLSATLSRSRRVAEPTCGDTYGGRVDRRTIRAAVFVTALAATPPALAVDGCLVLLCLAAPDWRQIQQCVDPVQQALNDLRRGRPFPHCEFSGPGNGASDRTAQAPDLCPPHYTVPLGLDDYGNRIFGCNVTGVITVQVQGQDWTRVWWHADGWSVTEYLPPAKAQLGTWNTRYDDDYAAWLAAQTDASPDLR